MKKLLFFLILTFSVFELFASRGVCVSNDGLKKVNNCNKLISAYNKIVNDNTESSEGFIITHMLNGKLYFEIPKHIMGRDFLLASRVVQLSDNSKVGAGQMSSKPIMFRFGLDDNNVMMYKPAVDMLSLSTESDDLKLAVERNAMTPIWNIYSVEAINPKTNAVVIEVTKLFEKEIDGLTPFTGRGRAGSINAKGGKFLSVRAFPRNVEIENRFIYKGKSNMVAIMHRSLVLLSKKPMRKRLADSRIGYLSSSKMQVVPNFKGTEREAFIHRWRIEPKPEDIEKYNRGELVEPAKPIVYYVDDALPNKWRKYVKAGIEDWQAAFEAIGFKNAIIAKDYPVDDPDFNPNDIRNSCFRYIASATANAMGPSWIDPRSGEIIQGDVIWYHSVINRLYTWRYVQTSAVDERIRKLNPDDELLGEAIRYAAAHEIGHTLGLSHNFGASYSFPVDSLRSVSFTQKYGTTASIMDYARFNYIAQPEDKGVKLTPPLIGEYDKFAIKYGYKVINNVDDYRDEASILNSWFLENKDKPMLQFGAQGMFGSVPDPSAQAEDLGDDAIKAGEYGIKNLKYIAQNYDDWFKEDNKGYGRIVEIKMEIQKQFERYVRRVAHFIGGTYKRERVQGEEGQSIIPVPVEKQKESLDFVFKHMRDMPEIISNNDLKDRLGSDTKEIYKFQTSVISSLLDVKLFTKLLEGEEMCENGGICYTLAEYLNDLHSIVWESTDAKNTIDKYEKNIQVQYLNTLLKFVNVKEPDAKKSFGGSKKGIEPTVLLSNPLVIKSVDKSKELISRFIKKTKGDMKYHYKYMYKLIVAAGF